MLPFETPSTAVVALDDLISSRSMVRQSLKSARHDSPPDWIGAIRALQDYLPRIAEVYENYGSMTFKWRLPWSSPHFKTKRIGGDFELGMTGLSLVLCLVRASELAQEAKEYKRAGHLLREAEAVAMYLVDQNLEASVEDLSPATLTAIVHILDGMGHEFLLNKLLDAYPEKEISASVAGLHTRIAIHAVDEYRHSLQLVPKPLRAWCESHEAYCTAMSHVLMAIEQAARGSVGKALGHLRLAQDATRKDQKQLALLVARLTQQYESDNKLVAFQPIPPASELKQLPSGRRAYQVKAWGPDQQSPGPGDATSSQEYY